MGRAPERPKRPRRGARGRAAQQAVALRELAAGAPEVGLARGARPRELGRRDHGKRSAPVCVWWFFGCFCFDFFIFF